jgi:hypothetical protein
LESAISFSSSVSHFFVAVSVLTGSRTGETRVSWYEAFLDDCIAQNLVQRRNGILVMTGFQALFFWLNA